MRRFPLVALPLLLTTISCQTSATPGPVTSAPRIEIASQFPLHGLFSFPELDRAVDAAIAEHPSIDGYRLVHVSLDDSLANQWNIDRALQNMKRAVGESPILGVIGPWTSEEARVLIPKTAPANLVVLSPSNTVDCLTDPAMRCLAGPTPSSSPRNYFRLAARDTLDADAAADFAVHRLGVSRLAVITNPIDTPYAKAMADAFSNEIFKVGGRVVYSHDFFPRDKSFAPLLRDAKAAGAQAVYMSVGQSPACAVRKDMKDIFPADAYLISGDRVADDFCIQAADLVGKTDDHLVLAIATSQPATIPTVLTGLNKGKGYPIYTFSAYDCARILIDAIDRAIRANGGKIPSREQVLQAVASTANFRGITGTYSFDANGDVATPGFSFYTVQQGNWAFWRNP